MLLLKVSQSIDLDRRKFFVEELAFLMKESNRNGYEKWQS
jgi:hypothetical protein